MNYWQYLIKKNDSFEIFCKEVFREPFAYEWNEFIKERNLKVKNNQNASFNKKKFKQINTLW